LEQWVQQQGAPGAYLLQPALTLWFDLPASVAAARLATARVPDKFEAQPQAFFEAVASGYARRLAEQPQRFARVDADQPLQAVRAQVLAALRETGFLA
jgi:dTMP kinase